MLDSSPKKNLVDKGQVHGSLTQGSQKIQGTGQFPYLGKCNLQKLKDPVKEPRSENCRLVFEIR
jgi:hypothetical protein